MTTSKFAIGASNSRFHETDLINFPEEVQNHLPRSSVQISGVTVVLDDPVDSGLFLKFSVNKTDFPRIPYNAKDNLSPRWSLEPYLTLREGSTLTLRIKKRRKFLAKYVTLVKVAVTYETIHAFLASVSQDHFLKFKINDQPTMWLELAAGPYALQTSLNAAVQKSKELQSVLDELGRSRAFLSTLLDFAVAVSELDPIAKAVMGCVRVVYEKLENQDSCDKLVVDLAASMARTLRYIEDVQQFARLHQLKKTIEEVYPLMEDTQNFILLLTNRSGMDNFLKAHSINEKVELLNKRYNVFQKQFDRGVAVDSASKTEMLLNMLKAMQDNSKDDVLLRQLRPRGAAEMTLAPECMEGTRQEILSRVDEWINDFKTNNVLWIRGFPGVGKSTLASSIVTLLRAQNRLGSFYVFDRAKATLATPNALWRCVAYDLARLYPSARTCIVERLQEEEIEVNSSNIKTIFRSLIEEPLSESDENDIPYGRLPVIVIDALDECGGLQGQQSEDREGLLETLQRWPRLDSRFKLIVTSRQEADITSALTPFSTPIDIVSGTSTNSQASDDVRAYLMNRFRKIAEGYEESLPIDWPGTQVIEQLTTRAAGLFIWAKTVTEFINSGEPQTQLREIMNNGADTVTVGDMTLLYSHILQTSFKLPSPEVLQSFHSLVGAMIIAKRPLGRAECIDLLGIQPSMLEFIRRGLKSVMDPGNTLRFTHQSFVDFLLSPGKRAGGFEIDVGKQEVNLATACLKTMEAKLCFNIGDLEISTIKNVDVPNLDQKIRRGIPSYLGYSCRYWADHLVKCDMSQEREGLNELVRNVMYHQLLYWFEVMSLMGEMNLVTPILTELSEWVVRLQQEEDEDETLDAFIDDALRFIAAFGHPIAQSTPHIYISALPFSPRQSKVARRFLPQYSRTLRLKSGKPNHWPSILFVSEEHVNPVNTVAFSPNDDYIVSGSSDKTICICDAETGNLISGPFEGHDSAVASVAFSPDGRKVVSGSDDLTVRVWVADSGDELLCLRGHTNVVTCVAFSGDGRRIASGAFDMTIRIWDADTGDLIGEPFVGHKSGVTCIAFSKDENSRYIASGSVDRTVRIWDRETGVCTFGPFVGHGSRVNSVAFSPIGSFVASGSEDETIKIWDLEAEDGIAISEPLEGHTDAVTSVQYTPDGKYIVSASHDETIRVWDMTTAEVTVGPLEGHTNGIMSISVSSDGKRVVSGSRDETVRMWDLDTREVSHVVREITETVTHTDGVTSVAFSPCGTMLVSGSDDDTVRVWDVETGRPKFHPINGHSSWINTVAWSPCGQYIASGSDDQTICIWSASTGELVYQPLEGHRNGITSIAFFPDGKKLLSGSYDESVRVWDIDNTVMDIFGPLNFHASWVTCVSVSQDGKMAVSSSYDKSIKLWSTETGTLLNVRFAAHPGAVNCVVFSANGCLVASGSVDGSIRIWDVKTGDLIAEPLFGHEALVYGLTFSADDHYIASCSEDRTIRVWDVGTRSMVLGPLYGHAGAVVHVVFSPDGKRLASCSEDETVRVWDLAEYGPGIKSAKDMSSSGLTLSTLSTNTNRGAYTDKCSLQNGWITGPNGELLFWVPPWNRHGLWWPRNTTVISRTSTKVDLTRFEYGNGWVRCREPYIGSS